MVCIDTSFAIDLLRGNNEAKDRLVSMENSGEIISIASPSVMELVSGSILTPKTNKEKDNVIKFILSFNILPLEINSAIKSGEIEADLIKKGQIIQTEDIMIGAIALINNEVVLTRNKKHFEKIANLRVETY